MQIKKASIKTGFSIHTCGHNEVYLCPLIIENQLDRQEPHSYPKGGVERNAALIAVR
jgi:hypothetical protein